MNNKFDISMLIKNIARDVLGQWPEDMRLNRTMKGSGYFGPLQRPDGGISTELSIGVDDPGLGPWVNDVEPQIPLLVPTLDEGEIDHILAGLEPAPEMYHKAIEYAKKRRAKGLDPFAQEGEQSIPWLAGLPSTRGRNE